MTNKKIILPKIPDYFHRELINDKGLQGNIFRFNKELIYKVYKTDNFNLPQLELLTEQVSTYMAFPKVLVFEGDYSYEGFKGYLSDYIEGNVIYDIEPITKLKGTVIVKRTGVLKCFLRAVFRDYPTSYFLKLEIEKHGPIIGRISRLKNIIKRRKSIFKEYHRIEKDIEELENDA